MTDEKDDKWVMPKPVFRTTPGALPKSLQKTISGYNMPKSHASAPGADDDDGDDILSVLTPQSDVSAQPAAEEPIKAAETEAEPEAAGASAEPVPESAETAEPADTSTPEPIKVTAAAPKPAKKSGFGSFVLIFLLVAALAAGLVYAIIYFLSRQAGNGPF